MPPPGLLAPYKPCLGALSVLSNLDLALLASIREASSSNVQEVTDTPRASRVCFSGDVRLREGTSMNMGVQVPVWGGSPCIAATLRLEGTLNRVGV